MALYDIHNHSSFSHDGTQSIEEMCEKAIELGVEGIAVTDHCDIEYFHENNERQSILASVEKTKSVRAKQSNIKLFTGIEIGEAIFDREAEKEILSAADYDVVLGSVHAVRCDDSRPFSMIDFTDYSSKQIDEYLNAYFDDMIEMSRDCDFDVLTHINVPFRYICGKYKHRVDIMQYASKISTILKQIISRGICLEVNSSSLDVLGVTMPDASVLWQYRLLGGRLVSLGSDSHSIEQTCVGIDYGRRLLRDCGFNEACYFENRQLKLYNL